MVGSPARRKQSFGEAIGPDRGLVLFQTILLVVALLGAPLEALLFGRGFTLVNTWVSVIVGGLVFFMALQLSGRARSDLSDSFTMSPTPQADAQLIERGVYSRLRHPMYLSIIIGLTGWAIAWGSLFGLLASAVVAIFFSLKARHEERLLTRHYPDYSAYRERVPGGIVPLPRQDPTRQTGVDQ